MFGLSGGELIVILIIFLVLFGPSKLPELGRTLALSIRNFQRGLKEASNNVDTVHTNIDNNVAKENKKEEQIN
ncbi:MAG: twin-arginine translocase TatA/TatE family subunit [Oligoflexia bacterium]|nr:twin-arginine translocase TatA/TatE family subunit [Oligoflexia bacterium]